ncbi:hypothetical protein ACJZ2D_009209 [Fusarium nematophilum]
MSSMSLNISICLILGCALVGGYAGLFTSYNHGFFEAIRVCISESGTWTAEQCVLDMPGSRGSLSKSYTGIASVDSLINVLLEFFAQGLRSHPNSKGLDTEALLAFGYLATQFGGVWFLMALEGLRLGNRGNILSWTGTFGIIFQAATITIIAPIYLALQLLLSPPASQPNSVLADPCDLALLPVSTVLSYVLPTIGLGLPLLNVLSREAEYLAIALWQPFPVYQTAIQTFSRLLCRSRRGKGKNTAQINARECRRALGRAYGFISYLTISIHSTVVAVIVTSAMTNVLSEISASEILALTSLTNPPTLALLDPPLSATSSRAIVVSFLRWDVYCACASMVIWAAYQLHAVRKQLGITALLLKPFLWALVGGPIFPAVMLLWERDDMVLNSLEMSRRHGKEK